MPYLDDDDPVRLSAYLHRANGYTAPTNREENHSDPLYSRSPLCKPEYIYTKPLRTLFVHPTDEDDVNLVEDVDVESVTAPLDPPYDQDKAINVMQETERHVTSQHQGQFNPEWEDQIPKINWSNMQARLFNRVIRLLHNDRLARLACEGDVNEPVCRRTAVDKTARRLRQTLASVAWNIKYTQWLHNVLMDYLPTDYLVSYLDALQTVKSKVPTLVERMVASVTTRALVSPSHELLSIIHKRPWDPVIGGVFRHKMKKLPREPILVMVPAGPGAGNTSHSRTHHWMANLSALGTVVCVYSPPADVGKPTWRLVGKVSVANCLDHMLSSTKAKVAELHQDYPDKPIVLVGIGSGAALALQVALGEKVKAVVCLGFPMYTVEDNRGTPDDALLNLTVPTLFVTGQNAATSTLDDLEDLREKLNTVTSLVLVGGADDQLRLTKSKKKLEKVTQSMVDKCVMDEVGDFLGTLLSPDYLPPTKPRVAHHVEPLYYPRPRPVMKPVVERKRKIDMISPDAVLPVKKGPGRKPKISMMQKMVQNKWAGQLPVTPSEGVRSPVSQGSVATIGGGRQVTLEKKRLQQISVPPKPVNPAEGTITVVAASSPSLNNAVKSRLSAGQLTSLTSILPPGSRGVISPSRSGSKDLTVQNVSEPPLLDELNILDMPVILGDQADELLPPPPATTQPVRLVLANKAPPLKCTKIYISKGGKGGKERKTVYIGDIKTGDKTVSKIRQIPATKNTQFF
ncbi:KAT8 regulatory NSL complex subunit 3-like [Macrosteles quadrilineatus]|uniref:KAT8 regulatory NSL complex subunit 3-like n=1 Tax=Macrosteles quadrilineatus TaxID=74068 RepID=UPI0023E0D06F|nr:KAT8 regulatory NSL complex subunit 3-like [Macrosteles quadrilineatus]